MLKLLTYYGQYYAHVKRFVLKNLAVLLEYIHLHHKNFNVVTVLLEVIRTTVAQIIIIVDVLLEYIDLQSYFQSSTAYYAGIMLDAFSYLCSKLRWNNRLVPTI